MSRRSASPRSRWGNHSSPTGPLLNLLLGFGLLAAPLAWTAQVVVGYGIGDASCAVAGMRWGLDSHAATAALFAATCAIGLAGLAISAWLQRSAPRDERGRVAFMAAAGVLVSSVFMTLILLGGIAALSIEHCRPG